MIIDRDVVRRVALLARLEIDEDEVAEELGGLFKAAVTRRSRVGERVGLTLSGGLDS